MELIGEICSDAVRSRHISWEIMRRDLRSQYRTSLLRSMIPLLPALTTAAWAILCRDAHLINVGSVDMPYPFFVLCGMMLWAAFLESMDAPISGIAAEQGLLSKSSIPPETVTLARLGQVMVNFGVKSLLIVIAAVCYRVHVSPTVVLAPLGVLIMITLGTSIGLILAPINLLYTDVSKALPVITTFWFFTTPVIFATPQDGWPRLIMNHLNPVTPLLTATRELAFGNGLSMPAGVTLTTALTLVLFLVAIVFHRLSMGIVIDRANA